MGFRKLETDATNRKAERDGRRGNDKVMMIEMEACLPVNNTTLNQPKRAQ